MPYRPKSTMEQWRILQAVVDAGGYAQAADLLNKSQSSLNHAVAKLQYQLGVELLEVKGRKAFLTPAGEVMLRRSRLLTQQIEDLELLASNINVGWEPEIRIAVELVYPKQILYRALAKFHPISRGSRIQIIDTVITGSTEMILEHKADLVIAASPSVPKGYIGEPLTVIQMVPVVGKDHLLAQLPELDLNELSQHLQIVIRDTASKPKDVGWLRAEQRWTVNNFFEAVDILKNGIGFCWLPEHLIDGLLKQGILVRLAITQSSARIVPLALVTPKEETLGPGSRQLRELLLAEHKV
ncbi:MULTISPECIES: LysR family transcriptional regulator [Rheinheimera]|jgi:DNA-binding transcriptional LysR family regulator|uniref:LysR family transcriptional regulator n=1 Tax=Rheinheimera tangshanensis TaxID=400153 RepID=A0A5C8M1D3_9GAMM|nr:MULTISPECIES: LysR family transcriptional regulator [Rheinheimera]KOO59127.1 LysR family transcriptional regulator [Rheinheimera sp. KL1]TXK81779.1 LysR family transcriptional regulator [Rheinheimera tangshanensis]GGM55223.1 LysR family transcriptional regulator [Rheinheimera tangshanensis]